jgi:hypothetical protein
MWIAAFGRTPSVDEAKDARAFLDAERATLANNPDAAARDRAAYTALAHAMFAAKEFVFLR